MSKVKLDSDAASKEFFLQELAANEGYLSRAYKATKISQRMVDKWRSTDPVFADHVLELREFWHVCHDDEAEEALLKRVRDNDTTAIIFYNKTRNKDRGYTDRDNVHKGKADQVQQTAAAALPSGPAKSAQEISRRIKGKRDYIVKLLKEEGKYTKELTMQVNLVAQLMVRTDDLRDIIFSGSHSPVTVETSREGNDRYSVNPVERLYLDYAQRTQRALQALGMNTDSKERPTDNDGFNNFLEQFKDD